MSVVLATRDRAAILDGALQALMAAVRPDDEVIVVDSASRDPRVREIVETHGATYLRCERPGASVARNAGWRRARHEIVGFIDDDVRVSPDWAEAVSRTFASHPDVAFLTGRVDEPPGEVAERAVSVKNDAMPAVLDRSTRGSLGQTANSAVLRSALAAVGGFDEQLGPGSPRRAVAEDSDLYDRLLGSGFVGRYEPSVRAYHLQWRQRRDLVRLDWQYGLGSGFRLAKLIRRDRARARVVARSLLWDWGIADLARAVRRRHEFGVLFAGVRLVGLTSGLGRGLVTRLDGGHFAAPRRRRA